MYVPTNVHAADINLSASLSTNVTIINGQMRHNNLDSKSLYYFKVLSDLHIKVMFMLLHLFKIDHNTVILYLHVSVW